ncbi:MAG TPA: DUF664 domain-containing protein [Pseudonocardia sp.]
MSTTADILTDGFERVSGITHAVLNGLDAEQLAFRADPSANSIGWLVWHLTRVQDDHVADVAGLEQVWTVGGWADRFGLPFPTGDIGYGHRSEEVAAVRPASPGRLLGYHDAVHEQTVRYLATLTDAELDRVVDEAWDPPVTLAARLVSVLSDDLQHAGQAAFVRGLAARR